MRLNTADGEIKSSVLTLRLAKASSTLEELGAEGRAWSSLSGGYETVSDTLVYQVESQTYILTGKRDSVAQVKQPKQDASKPNPSPPAGPAMCKVTTGLLIKIQRKDETVVTQPGASESNRITTEQPCSAPLRRRDK